MATQKPLVDMIPSIVNHFNSYRDHLEFDHKVFKVYEGQVRKEIEDSLKKEMLSQTAYNRAVQRIPSINILKKATDKLSKLYADTPIRFTDKNPDRDLMHTLEKEMYLNTTMLRANQILNAQNRAAVEFFVKDGIHRTRVLAAHQFLPYSDDKQDPNNMTVFIKLMGKRPIIFEQATDSEGNDLSQNNEVELTDILALYSDDEFLVIDTEGSIRFDVMSEMGVTSTANPFGTIPFVYLSKSDFQLVPFVNQAGFDISLLIPKLLTDLNYAAQFMSHSLIWYKNADLQGAEAHPDAMINLGTAEKDDHDAQIGTIDPKVDIERVLQLTQFEMAGYFSSIGIKTSGASTMMPGREASGISKMIDEGDSSAEQKTQAQKFTIWEHELWSKVDQMQRILSASAAVVERRVFTDNFLDTFVIHYSESRPFKSEKDKIEEIRLLRDSQLISRRRAIHFINPSLSDEQLDEWEAELDKEKEAGMAEMLSIAGREPQPEDDGEENPESVEANPRDDQGA